MEKLNEYFQIALDKVVFFAPKALLAVVILWMGFKLIKKAMSLLELGLAKAGFSGTIHYFEFFSVYRKVYFLTTLNLPLQTMWWKNQSVSRVAYPCWGRL